MNLLEHCIQEIHSVTDITEEYIKRTGRKPKEPLYDVDLTYGCYGTVKREKRHFFKSEFKQAKENGYFMA